MKATIVAAFLCGLLATAAQAQTTAIPQGASIEFRMDADPANLAGCRGLDATLSRVHSITPQGETARLKLAGGFTETLKQTSPGIYTTVFTLSGVRLDVMANASASPRTLTVTDKNRGCHWNAIAK